MAGRSGPRALAPMQDVDVAVQEKGRNSMSPFPLDTESWIGSTLIDGSRHRLGTIEEIYVDDESDLPLWMVVRIGRFRARHTFVPLAGATRSGDAVLTPYDRLQIEQAPDVDVDEEVPDEELRALYAHYGLPYGLPGDTPRESLAERVLRYVA